jgi:hypothetical protein
MQHLLKLGNAEKIDVADALDDHLVQETDPFSGYRLSQEGDDTLHRRQGLTMFSVFLF